MSEEKKAIPYKVQKGNRPKIEEVIAYCLNGELQKNAIDFTMWMRENKMPFNLYTSNTRSYRVDYKKWTFCYMFFHHLDDDNNEHIPPGTPSHVKISPTLILFNRYKDIIISENLTNIKWEEDQFHGCNPCRNGNGGCGHKGVDRTIFNENFKLICKWRGLQVKNPDTITFEIIKKLILLDKNAKDERDALELEKRP